MCEALARLTDPGVAAPWVQAREIASLFVSVRRTPTEHYPRALFRAYPLAPFAPRHPPTYSWERGGGMPGYAAGVPVLSTPRVVDPAQLGVNFRVEN